MKSIEEVIEMIREAFYEYGRSEFKRGRKVVRRVKNGELGYCDYCGHFKGSRLFTIPLKHNTIYLCEKHFHLLKLRLQKVI